MENVKITSRQLIQLIFISRIIIAITYLPSLSSPPKNQDVWVSTLLYFPISILLSIPIYLLFINHPNNTIIQCSKILLGKASIFIEILLVWYFIHIAVINLAQLEQFLVSALMQETPVIFFAISMTVFCTYTVSKGIEVMGRMSELIAPIIIVSLITIVVLLIKDMHLNALEPILEKGFLPVFHGGFTSSLRNSELLAFAMLLPHLNDSSKAKKTIIYCFLLLTFFFVLILIPILLIWGAKQARNLPFPFYSVLKIVYIGGFLQRVDAIYLAIWILGIFMKTSLFYYLAAITISEIFNFNGFKPFIIPVGSILIPLSILIAPSVIELREFLSYKVLTWYSLFYILFIPSFLLIVSILRKKGEKKNEKTSL